MLVQQKAAPLLVQDKGQWTIAPKERAEYSGGEGLSEPSVSTILSTSSGIDLANHSSYID